MRKKIIVIFTILFSFLFAYIVYDSAVDLNKPGNESDIEGKDISKEEYIYKEDLLTLGYSVDEVNIIENKISTTDVKNYLLKEKYNNITKFIYSPYFKIEDIQRYENYYLKNPNYSTDEVVLNVEIGLDSEFYTNIKEIENYTEITTLINKYNILPKDAKFNDLVVLEKPYSNNGKHKIRKAAYDSLKQMIDDAKKENLNLYVISGFRTWDNQNTLFNNNKKKNGLDHALMYSAKPGHSEHQLGLAVDFNKAYKTFENTKEYEWLKLNAYKYGFIERYKKGKEYITGFAYEPWHYRYLGVDIATKIYEENITYEEYLIKYKTSSINK